MNLTNFNECLEIVEKNDNFKHKEEYVDGYKFHIFCYNLANYEDFENYNSYELRGLTFLEHPNGKFIRFLHLHKFFNYNQGVKSSFESLKDKKIISVQSKEDGSMIIPIVVDNKIYCKTQKTFFSDQAKMANEIIENNTELKEMILEFSHMNLIPIFELVSPFNQVVLQYNETELVLLQIRNLTSGLYFPLSMFKIPVNIPSKHEIKNLPYYIKECETLQDKEGYIIQFEDDQFIKLKTQWYRDLHGLLVENIMRENRVIEWTLNNDLDDIICHLKEEDVRRKFAKEISSKISVFYYKSLEKILKIDHENHFLKRKDFAIKFKSDKLFPVLIQVYLDKKPVDEILKDFILKKTKHLNDAKKFLEEI